MGETEVKGLRRQKPGSGGNAARPRPPSRLPQQLSAASLHAAQPKLELCRPSHLLNSKEKAGWENMPCSASRAFLLFCQLLGCSAWWRGREEAPKLSCPSASPRPPSRFSLSSLRRREPTVLAVGRSRRSEGRAGGREVSPPPCASTESAEGDVRGMGDKPISKYKQQVRGTPVDPSHTGGWPWHGSSSAACGMRCRSRGTRAGSRHCTDGTADAGSRVLHRQPARTLRRCLSLLRACLGTRLRTSDGW